MVKVFYYPPGLLSKEKQSDPSRTREKYYDYLLKYTRKNLTLFSP